MKKIKKSFITVLVSFIVCITMVVTSYAAVIPAPNAIPNQENILHLLKTYAPEAYYIANTTIGEENNMMSFMNTNEPFIKNIGTGVHEAFHIFADKKALETGKFGSAIYIDGNTYYLSLDKDKLFPTEEIAAIIPNNLKTFRYDTYVVGYSYSNSYGVQGLMDEFTAYYYGMYTYTHMIDYLMSYDSDGTGWKELAASLSNDMTAYSEFKFFIIQYLIYAKEHHPKTYNLIMESDFPTAFIAVDRCFSAEIETIEHRLPEINRNIGVLLNAELVMNDNGFSYYKNDIPIYGGPLNEYYLLTNELKKEKYIMMESAIEEKAEKPSTRYENKQVGNITTNLSIALSKSSNGVKIKINGQESYDAILIYRKDPGADSYKYLGTISTKSKTCLDKSSKNLYGRVYYRIVGVNMSEMTVSLEKMINL